MRTQMLRCAAAAAGGAALAYLLDPQMGRTRRVKLADQVKATGRRGKRKAGKRARYVSKEAYGVLQRTMHPGPKLRDPNDETLEQRVQSELFVDPTMPKGRVNIDAHDGVVVLRGQVDDEEQIDRLCAMASDVDGVRRVENLMHLPGEPPPNLEPLLRAAR